nr:zinc-binding dehydrogenase [Maliibacterium massiliense]
MVAQRAGAVSVAVADIAPERLAFMEKLGLRTFDSSRPDFFQQAMAYTQDQGYSAVFECSGSAFGARAMTDLCAPRGRCMLVGLASEPYLVDTWAIGQKELSIHSVRIHTQDAFGKAVALLKSGGMDAQLRALITDDYTFSQLPEMFDFALRDKAHCKIMVKVDEDYQD